VHQIDGASAVDGHFVDGTSTSPGTVVTAKWLNNLQDEICGVITSLGVALNENSTQQLRIAVEKHIQNALIPYQKSGDLSSTISELANDTSTPANHIRWLVHWMQNVTGVSYPNL